MSTIAAIIPTFNRAALLAECIPSLLEQTRPVDEILVVDDGSTDGTDAVVAGFGSRLRYLRQENAGKAAALNRALGLVRADHVWICDDDDLALPDAAAVLGGALDAAPAAGLAYGRYLVFDDASGGPAAARPPGYWPEGHAGDELRALLEDMFIFQFATLVRRSCYTAAGPFNEAQLRSQDTDMAIRLLRRHAAVFVDRPVFLQRAHDGARGSGRARFAAGQMTAKWVQYDRILFARLRAEMRPEEFLPRGLAHLTGPEARRVALLQRACVLARRQMWEEALADLEAAVRLAGAGPALAGEREIAGRFLLGKHGCPDLATDAALRARLAGLCGGSAYGREIGARIARPLVFRAREAFQAGRRREALGFLLALGRISGAPGLLRALGSSLGARLAQQVLAPARPRHAAHGT